MSRKIVYLINPISGTVKKDGLQELIETETKAKEIAFEIISTNAAGNYNFLREKIAKENITDVVMVGGDGTVNQVVNALKYEDVQFGILPVGSGNGLARAALIPVKPKDALQLIFSGNAKKTDAFIINNQFSCMLSGIGFDAKVAHDFSTKASRGLLTYTTQSLIQFFKAQPYQFEVTIAPHASLNDGLLDIVIVQKMNKAKLPFAIIRQLRGNNKLQEMVEKTNNKNILYFQTPSLTIKNLKHAPFHVDGEPRETADVFEVEIIKDCFNLIYGEQA